MASKNSRGFLFYFFSMTALFLIYLISGVYYNTKRHNLRGVEAVPHIEKWRKAPSVIEEYSTKAVERFVFGTSLARAYFNRKMTDYKEVA